MDNKLSKITIVLLVLSVIMTAIGGTFAWLTANANITNGTYTAMTHCFLIDYNINNVDGTQDITGTMFPSANATGGLNGRVGLKINDNCELNGTGTLKLHINNTTSSTLTSNVASYCESRKTLKKIDGITTKEACTTANGRWQGYGDSYCENPTTLERLKDYTTQSDCTTNGGTWTTGGSPLKYALYNTTDTTQNPIAVGHITSSDIGNDITLKNDILITDNQEYYYIYIWLDGYMTDNTFTELSFSGSVSASAIQNNDIYTVTFDANGGNVSISNKAVSYGEQYGSLPTPTRDRYTFLGWNGRNLYDVNNRGNVTSGVTVDSNDYITINTSSGVQYYNYWTHNLNVLTDTYYLIVLETGNINNQAGNLYVTSQGGTFQFKNTVYSANQLESNHVYLSKTQTTSNATYDYGIRTFYGNARDGNNQFLTNTILTFRISVLDVDDSITSTNFEYEPYYITSSTTVVQNKNHTLTAIWQEN